MAAQDVLFTARVRTLDDADLVRLHAAITTVLPAMSAGGGRDTEKDLFNEPGGYRTLMSAKSNKTPCPSCAGPITRESFLGGTVYYCGVCQPST